jgi:hypothetical protein
MHLQLSPITSASAHRLIAACPSGTLYLVWDNAILRIPPFDLGHLAAVLDAWGREEEPPVLRRGYYRVAHTADGALMLWINGVALGLSRNDLRTLLTLLQSAEQAFAAQAVESIAGDPFGPDYQVLAASRGWNN